MKVPLIGICRHRLTTDGTGVTTLVAFHGCPLNCRYCLNSQCLRPDGVWQRLSVEEILQQVIIDNLYFQATGGGICFGGGEPLLRSDVIATSADDARLSGTSTWKRRSTCRSVGCSRWYPTLTTITWT